MHYALTASTQRSSPDHFGRAAGLPHSGAMLGIAVVGAVLLVMGSGFSTYVIDLRSRTESAERINQLSFNDTMTGLPNRIAFNERLAFDAAEAHEKAHKLAAFSIDVDGFKDVNDVFGHSRRRPAADRGRGSHAQVLGRANFWRGRAATNFWGCRCPAITRMTRRPLPNASRRCSRSRSWCRTGGHPDRVDRLLGLSDRHARARPGAEQRQARDVSRQEQAARHRSRAISARWTTRPAPAVRWRAICKVRSSATNWSCTTSCRPRCTTAESAVPKR